MSRKKALVKYKRKHRIHKDKKINEEPQYKRFKKVSKTIEEKIIYFKKYF